MRPRLERLPRRGEVPLALALGLAAVLAVALTALGWWLLRSGEGQRSSKITPPSGSPSPAAAVSWEDTFTTASDAGWTAAEANLTPGAGDRGKLVVALMDRQAADSPAFGAVSITTARLDWLKKNGLDPKAADDQGLTLLHHAAKRGQVPFLRWLLENGADPAARDKYGWTALDHAARSGAPAAVHALLAKNAPGANAAIQAAWLGELAADLKGAGADPVKRAAVEAKLRARLAHRKDLIEAVDRWKGGESDATLRAWLDGVSAIARSLGRAKHPMYGAGATKIDDKDEEAGRLRADLQANRYEDRTAAVERRLPFLQRGERFLLVGAEAKPRDLLLELPDGVCIRVQRPEGLAALPVTLAKPDQIVRWLGFLDDPAATLGRPVVYPRQGWRRAATAPGGPAADHPAALAKEELTRAMLPPCELETLVHDGGWRLRTYALPPDHAPGNPTDVVIAIDQTLGKDGTYKVESGEIKVPQLATTARPAAKTAAPADGDPP